MIFRLLLPLSALTSTAMAASARATKGSAALRFARGLQAGDGLAVSPTHIVTPRNFVPRPCANADVTAVASGTWSDPSTWSGSAVPTPGSRVSIPASFVVTYDLIMTLSDAADCVEVGGELSWSTTTQTVLVTSNLLVLPGGTATIGTGSSPCAAPACHAEIVISDVALDNTNDVQQFGNGVLVFGRFEAHGRSMGRTFLRLSAEASAGNSTLSVESDPTAEGWMGGDRLLLPDTRHIPWTKHRKYNSEAEDLTCGALTAGTAEIPLGDPLAYDHKGPRDAIGNQGPTELSMFPHVANLERNVVIRSTRLDEALAATGKNGGYCMGAENTDGTSAVDCVIRGHFMAFHRADVDVRFAKFENLGRTTNDPLDSAAGPNDTEPGDNQIGRYSVHFHHVMGPVNVADIGYQFVLLGNVVEGALKWGIAVHGTHYGLVKDNIAYDGMGSLIVTEDGSESFNIFERNMVVHTKAEDEEQILETVGRGGVFSNRALFGTTRDGFWFSGMNNYVRDNVVANAPDFAYNYNGYYLNPNRPIPNFRGANMDVTGQYTVVGPLPALEAVRNEAYGATGQGLWATWSRGCCSIGQWTGQSEFKDFRIWHVNNRAVEFYHESLNTLEGFMVRNDHTITAQSGGGTLRFNTGFKFDNPSYENGETIFRNNDIQGFNVGIAMPIKPVAFTAGQPQLTLLEDSHLHNYVNVQQSLPNIDNMTTLVRNVTMEVLDIPPINLFPSTGANIQMKYSLSRFTVLVDRTAHFQVFDFDGEIDNNFVVYFEEQAPDYPIPPPPSFDGRLIGCPVENITNIECMNAHGVAVAGVVAPCIEVDGETDCAQGKMRADALGVIGLVFFDDGAPSIPPVANADVTTIDVPISSVNVVANDVANNQGGLDPSSVTVTSGPARGNAIVNGDGTIDYEFTDQNFVLDTFIYTVQDDDGGVSNEATVTVRLNPV